MAPQDRPRAYTAAVATLWYQAPELLLGLPYGPTVDIWAFACIVAELLLGQPLAAGSGVIDQMARVMGLLGPPTNAEWPEGVRQLGALGVAAPSGPLSDSADALESAVMRHVPPAAARVLRRCLTYKAHDRPTARSLLDEAFFHAPGMPRRGGGSADPALSAAVEHGGRAASPRMYDAFQPYGRDMRMSMSPSHLLDTLARAQATGSPLGRGRDGVSLGRSSSVDIGMEPWGSGGRLESSSPEAEATPPEPWPWTAPPPLAGLLAELDGLDRLSASLIGPYAP